jgi:hypothetical protein
MLAFRRDGTATLTTRGVLGEDHSCSGSVASDGFEALADLIQRAGFFGLEKAYRHNELQDGEAVTTSAFVGGRLKVVANSNQAGPPNLKAIEDAIDALGEKTSWAGSRPSRRSVERERG